MNTSLVPSAPVYSRFGRDPDLAELVELFVSEMPERIGKFRDCTERSDWEALGHAAHQLTGSAGSYGFSQLTPALQTLESLARVGAAPHAIQAAVEEVIDLCSRARAGSPD